MIFRAFLSIMMTWTVSMLATAAQAQAKQAAGKAATAWKKRREQQKKAAAAQAPKRPTRNVTK